MKIFEEKLNNSKTRIGFICGKEDLEILEGLVRRARMFLPDIKNIYPDIKAIDDRLNSMTKEMRKYLGVIKRKNTRKDIAKCPYCEKQPRGEKALANHIKTVHSKENK